MRDLIILIALICFNTSANSQIRGNGNLKTTTYQVQDLTDIDIQLNANIVLDYSLEETMTITTDENLMDYVGIVFRNGKLTLDQKKWIEPSQQPIITIGSPKLTKVYQGTHSVSKIININTQNLQLEGNVGDIIASGSVVNLDVNSLGTSMDLRELNITNASIDIDGYAKVITDKVINLKTNIDDKGNLILLSKPDNYEQNNNVSMTKDVDLRTPNHNVKWIEFKIKNNSWKRNHFYVVGPKSDGSSFSYGFPMMPKSTRNEKWTVGTKIYKEISNRPNKLLVTISAEDAGTTVDLFND